MDNILLERLLTNKFTFGFELEGFTRDEDKLKEKLDSIFGSGGDFHNDSSLELENPDNENLKEDEVYVCRSYDNKHEWYITDHELNDKFREDEYDCDKYTVEQWLLNSAHKKPVFASSFEYSSPVLDFIPANIKKIWDFFKENLGREKLMFTTDSCGFHHHISFEGIKGEDAAWIISQLAMDDDAIEMFSHMKHSEDDGRTRDFNFLTSFSSADYLRCLRDYIKQFDFSKIASYLNTDKFTLLNNHANKTLEWRGPRNFLDTESITDIKEFYSQLWKVISWMSKALDKKEINGMSKENYLKGLSETNYAGKNKPLENYPSFKLDENHLLDANTLQLLVEKIENNPMILNSLTKDKRICDQIIQKLFNSSKLRKIIERMDESKISQTIYDLSYKYIPAVMAYKAGEDALYRTSPKTLERLASARYGFDTSTLPDIITYVVPKVNTEILNLLDFTLQENLIKASKYKVASIFATLLYNGSALNIMKKIYENCQDTEILFDFYEKLPEPLKRTEQATAIITKLVLKNPRALKYIDEISPYMLISILGSNSGDGYKEAQVVSQLLDTGKVTKKDIDSARSYFTRWYKHNFDDEL